jgi:hypothetical protein
MDPGKGASQVAPTLTSSATVSAQINWFRRFISPPLAAQTLGSVGTSWLAQWAAVTASSSISPWSGVVTYLGVWRPGTGAAVGTWITTTSTALPTAATTAEALMAAAGGSSLGTNTTIACAEGDVLVVEIGGSVTQGMTTAETWTLDYDGTTDDSITTCASYLVSPTTLQWLNPYRLQVLSGQASATSFSLAPTVTVGNLMLVESCTTAASGTITISDTSGHTWTELTSGAPTYIKAWYALVVTGGATTITVTDASQIYMLFAEIGAGKGAPMIDVSATGNGVSSAPSSGATPTPALTGDLAVALVAFVGAVNESVAIAFSPALTMDGEKSFTRVLMNSAGNATVAETAAMTLTGSGTWACWCLLIGNTPPPSAYLPKPLIHNQAIQRASNY